MQSTLTSKLDVTSIFALAFKHAFGVSQFIPFRELQAHVILVDEVSADHRFGIAGLQFEYDTTVHGSTACVGADLLDNRINCPGELLSRIQYKCHIEILAFNAHRVDLG